jgi:hypothetical protein
MSPRTRRLLLALLCALLVGGLLLCGPGHSFVHGDHDGAACDACHLAGTEVPADFRFDGPLARAWLSVPARCETVRTHAVLACGRPRGPPAC